MIAMALALASGVVADGTVAAFVAGTSNGGSSMATAALTAPQALTATAVGSNVNLGWNAGSFGGATGFGHRVVQRNMGVEPDPRDGAEGPTGTCSAADTFPTSIGRTAAATTTLTHAGAAGAVAGSYACYRAEAEYPAAPATGQWYSQTNNPVAMVMLGHVVKSVTSTNGGTLNMIDTWDTFTFTFNQPVNIATGPTNTGNPWGWPSGGHDLCVDSDSGVVLFGRLDLSSSCASWHSTSVGRITGVNTWPNDAWPSYHTFWTWTTCPVAGQCRVLRVTVGSRYRGYDDSYVWATTPPSFEPTASSGRLTSASNPTAPCTTANTATSACRPVPILGF